ncbi:molybdate ABC transporter permease subunit [Aestuariirhabdus litorea]|uniref:Molybdenum transport system permease n=1 Tax=Aestuariirhabdus litorea TaxID=2528527 RepID=A0A3P3VIZ3_9GAMM|nr:molybdate ABC transporter permease subunit [Aestuariirhabdus litorea]RRJ82695.1 molybdate ABC transporter permease subunit [Aestuariirhabdus litorea]RWW92855.1 molybdate ABC transporter permease subunit [Endozoicomonadaceae bacterium GTF-13]
MDWSAFSLSLKLALWTLLLLMPIGLLVGRYLATTKMRGKHWLEAALTLPLVLPPTVLGYYLLVSMGGQSWLGGAWQWLFSRPLAFSFEAILLASLLVNLPFAIQPVQRAFERLDPALLDAAACCGLSRWRMFWRIELPLVWPGLVTAAVMTFAHTLGEFGVVLMVGGSIPGQTQTLSIAIYDRMQTFDAEGAGVMSATLVGVALVAVTISLFSMHRRRGGHGR